MGKAFFITRMALSLIFMGIAVYYIDEVQSANFDYIWGSIGNYSSYDTYSSYSSYATNEAPDLTFEAGLITLLYLLLMQGTNIFALLKIKTKTVKILSIIGLATAGISILLALLTIASPESVSFDEIGPFFVLFAFGALGFGVVYLIHAIRVEKTVN